MSNSSDILYKKDDIISALTNRFKDIQCYDGSGSDIISDIEEALKDIKPYQPEKIEWGIF